MKNNFFKAGIVGALMLTAGNANAQEDSFSNKEGSDYHFTMVKVMDATEVANQNRTGTCWSFSALSFYESELIRTGVGKHNLSEMFIVRNAYVGKAQNYVRMHGNFNFGPGGAFHDIPWVFDRYGMVPEEVYKGLDYGTEKHNHNEMNGMLSAMVDVIKDNPQKKLTPSWTKAVEGVVDAYLGEVPEKFEYQGKEYTPKSYGEMLKLDMDDYISLTSYTHHDFYDEFILEIPDNWALGSSYNVTLDELMAEMEGSLMGGYTFAWGADVSEKGFSFRDGLAILPVNEESIQKKGKDDKFFNNAGAEKISNAFLAPTEEKWVTQEERQVAFDNFETTDDHGMHITGVVKDQNGGKYFIVKNSWGTDNNDCDGYFYASFAYARSKTMNIIVHKDAISKGLKKKLGIK